MAKVYTNSSAIFNQLCPYMNEFNASAYLNGMVVPSLQTYALNIEKVNAVVVSTGFKLVHLLKNFGNYFEKLYDTRPEIMLLCNDS